MVKLQPFDTAQHLDNPEVISCYLADAIESGDSKLFLRAVQNVARANNMSKIAREIGMSRTSLYWGENTSPEFTTVQRLLEKLGMRLRVEPIAKRLQAARERIALNLSELEAALLPSIEAAPAPHPLIRHYVPEERVRIRSMKARAKKLEAFLGGTTKPTKKRAASAKRARKKHRQDGRRAAKRTGR